MLRLGLIIIVWGFIFTVGLPVVAVIALAILGAK